MALVDNAWYIDYGDGSTTGYYAVTPWAAGAVVAAGALRRQLAAPAVNNERVFIAIVGGTTGGSEPSWTVTRGAKTTDNTVTWQEITGIAGINGDLTNTPPWTTVKNTPVTLGQVIKRNNSASLQICTTAGTAGNGAEPSFSDTAGTTTADGASLVWTSLGVVGNFTGLQAPHAREANAYAGNWGQAGNSFFIASESAETQASTLSIGPPGSAVTPSTVLCVAKTPIPPTAATTGATASSTGANSVIIGAAFAYFQGITFSAGSAANAAAILFTNTNNASGMRFRNCGFTLNNTNSGSGMRLINNNAGQEHVFENCTWTFGSNTAQAISSSGSNGIVRVIGGSVVVGANVPTTLITSSPAYLLLQGVDLSAFGAGKTLIGASCTGIVMLQDCKLGASVAWAATPTNLTGKFYLIRSDSSGTNYRHEHIAYAGSQAVETTIVRTGGASDGTTPLAWKIVTTANAKFIQPFESMLMTVWTDTVGAPVTATIYGIWGGGAVPNNDDIWIEVDYLGASGSPLGSIISSAKADPLATNAALTSDGSTWGGSTTPFKMSVTFTPQQKGSINILVKAAKASTTFYIDPKIEVS